MCLCCQRGLYDLELGLSSEKTNVHVVYKKLSYRRGTARRAMLVNS